MHTLPEQSQHGALNGTCSSFSLEIISKACLLPGFVKTNFAKLSYNFDKWRHTAGGLFPLDKMSRKLFIHYRLTLLLIKTVFKKKK